MGYWSNSVGALVLFTFSFGYPHHPMTQTTAAMAAQTKEKASGRINPDDVTDMLAEQYDCERHQVNASHFEYYDFTGDGKDELVLVASTCATGTAGPDVHAVYTRDAAGKVVELPFQRAEGSPFFSDRKWDLPLFGNPNYSLTVEKGLLVARWRDGSDRKNPLVIRYKWDGAAFVVDSKEQEGPFKTSYDCGKASKEIEQAICYSKSVAALDVELGTAYRERLRNAAPETKAALQEAQRKWLVERESKCVIYKWWVDCLTGLYKARIAELRQRGVKVSERINADDITDMLANQYDCDRHQIHADHVEYYDFTGDGLDELVLVASSCRGGHDIHGVYGRDAKGAVYELPFSKTAQDNTRRALERADDFLPLKSGEIDARHEAAYGMLFGIVFSDLSVQHGLLVETYHDASGRERPLVVRYQWNGHEFVADSVDKTGPFKTSYDCAHAEKEIEREICYVKTLADLDLELGDLYRRRLLELPTVKRTALQNDQLDWLAKRNGCEMKYDTICVEKLYKIRIDQLLQH